MTCPHVSAHFRASLRFRPALLLLALVLVAGATRPAQGSYPPLRTITTGSTALGNNYFSLYYEVFDPLRNQLRRYTTPAVHPLSLAAVDGVVVWTEQTYDAFGQNVLIKVHLAVYNPKSGLWEHGESNWETINSVVNSNGLVTWASVTTLAGGTQYVKIHYATYDPERGAWIFGESQDGNNKNLLNRDGVVEWTLFTSAGPTTTYAEVNYAVYDPARSSWRTGSSGSFQFSSNLTINVTNATVIWSSASSSGTRGYDPSTGFWYAGTAKPLAQFSFASISTGTPKPVLFWDMSLAGTAWSWNFGDGGASGDRSPSYTYNSTTSFTVTQTVTGPGGSSSTSKPFP
jgi:PKD repeat protein